jgi:hypothetical protein
MFQALAATSGITVGHGDIWDVDQEIAVDTVDTTGCDHTWKVLLTLLTHLRFLPVFLPRPRTNGW